MNIDLVLAAFTRTMPPIHTLPVESQVVLLHLRGGINFPIDGNARYTVTDTAIIVLRPANNDNVSVSRVIIPFDSILYIESISLPKTSVHPSDGRG